MKRLVDVEPETQAIIRKIEGGEDIKKHLEDLGVNQNKEIRVLEQAHRHEHTGAISLSVDDREVTLGHGMADKLYVDKGENIISLLELEEEDKGIIRAFGGGKDVAGWFSALDIKMDKEIKFLRHLPDDTLSFEVQGKPVTMGEGRASKILADYEGKTIQINYLKTGEKAKVNSIIGGISLKEEFEQQGIKEGADITIAGRDETAAPAPVKRRYVRAEIGGLPITIGYGMAKKVWVD